MLKSLARLAFFFLCVIPLALGCSDDTKHQSAFRGTWSLQSRKLPKGDVFNAPQVSGVIEWYPTSEEEAQVMISFSPRKDVIQVHEAAYSFTGQAFTAHEHLNIGGELGSAVSADYEAISNTIRGQVETSGTQVTLRHDTGSTFVFNEGELTITYKNGTVDTWTRLKDGKGLLAK